MYPRKETIIALCQKLHLPSPDPFEQDWQYVVVDPTRINDFMWIYTHDTNITDNEKMTLGILIIGSFNEALEKGQAIDDTWEASWKVLQKDMHLHIHTLHYWACLEDDDQTNWFPVAQKVRTVIRCYE